MIDCLPDIVTSGGYYNMARYNLLGAQRIAFSHSIVGERNSDPCIQFLLGWALEGFFKVYLAHKGYKGVQLRKIGHDLVQAREATMKEGLLIEQYGTLKFVVETLHPAHLKFYYRYFPSNPDRSAKTFQFVMPDIAFPVVGHLDEMVFPFVQAELNADEIRLGRSPTMKWPGLLV